MCVCGFGCGSDGGIGVWVCNSVNVEMCVTPHRSSSPVVVVHLRRIYHHGIGGGSHQHHLYVRCAHFAVCAYTMKQSSWRRAPLVCNFIFSEWETNGWTTHAMRMVRQCVHYPTAGHHHVSKSSLNRAHKRHVVINIAM